MSQVRVGCVVRAHGIRGEVVFRRFGDSPEILESGAELRFLKGEHEVTICVTWAKPHSRDWLVAFDGVTDRDQAEALIGTVFHVDAKQLPPLPDGTFYSFQLVGLLVVTAEGKCLGKIEEILETGANDVYVVRGEQGEVLLPSIPDVVRNVDLEEGKMTVNLVPGLLPNSALHHEPSDGDGTSDGGGVG